MDITIAELLDYTDEERAKWRQWFSEKGNEPLEIALAGGTHANLGALIVHCFWAELFYARWMRGEIINKDSEVVRQNKDLPTNQAEAIFGFGDLARREMRAFASSATAEDWDHEVAASGIQIRGTARKLISHILMHEIRHFAQVAIIVRQNDLEPPGDHDIVFSKTFGCVVKKG